MTQNDKAGSEHARQGLGGTVGMATLGPLLQGLGVAGIDVPKFCRARGIDPALLQDEDARVPVMALQGAWEEAAQLSGDPAFALNCASRVEVHTFGLFSYVAATSDSWGTALRRVQDYFRLLGDIGRYECWTAGERVMLSFVPAAPWSITGAQVCDFAIAVPFIYARRYVPDFALCDVLFPYDKPRSVTAHERLFVAPIRFATTELAFTFPKAFLSSPLRNADPHLDALLVGFARERLATLPQAHDPIARLRGAVREALQAGEGTLAGTATRVGLTPRTLQRRLAGAGTCFVTEVDEARRSLALKLVAQPQFSLIEIAFLLGFSDLAPFHRAFRRWTGSTPGRHRASGGTARLVARPVPQKEMPTVAPSGQDSSEKTTD